MTRLLVGGEARAIAISAIAGMAGVGKATLAVHVAHGTVLLGGGDVRTAEDAWTRARGLFAAAGSPETADITARLEDLPGRS